MKKLIPTYLVIAFLWAFISTIFGINSIEGRGGMYNFGRNVPGALVWPYGVITSPLKLYKWITTPSRSAVFQGAYDGCRKTMGSEEHCQCMIEVMQKNLTDAELSQADAAILQNQPLPSKFSAAVLQVRNQCRGN